MAYYALPPSIDDRHPAVAAWFLGPQAENFDILKGIFESTLDDQRHARKTLYPKDEPFITKKMQESTLFTDNITKLEDELRALSKMLSQHSIPFWSARYQAHMNMDTSFPAVLGYLVTMLYNPNNVALEASPLTTLIETYVGAQLCEMLGFRPPGHRNPVHFHGSTDEPEAWGHITCDGSVANLESIWAARNIKYYPFSLKLAIVEGGLNFLANADVPYSVELCSGEQKEFMKCTSWELLNLKPSTILNIPQDLYEGYGISQTFLQNVMQPYLVQSKGMGYMERFVGMKHQSVYYVGTTMHYSWPKGAAVAGIGRENVIAVPVDNAARMDVAELDKLLVKCIESEKEEERIPIYAVVAIMGSTEHGAVDPLAEVLELREKYQAKGLSFVVHCDGAWGGYFASMIRLSSEHKSKPHADPADLVPVRALSAYTRKQIEAYKYADSITIDPHKSGYIQYPAGGLCYRDGRMRYLVTWTSPIVFHKGDVSESIGVYGVEGSKPGAAPVAAYLSHEVIGLHCEGYGTLLGEATFTSVKLYTHWATMSLDEKSDLVVVPFNMLPTEQGPDPDPKKIREQKEWILKRITNRPNSELVDDPEAMELMQDLGSDLMINAFACNFRINGKINKDVGEANYLNQRIFQRTSISKVQDKIDDKPIILTSTSLSQKDYKGCLTHFKKRLGLVGDQDLFILVNVTMSPWPTANNFIGKLAQEFQDIAKEEVAKGSLVRNTIHKDKHGFVMQGTDKVHYVHLPMFYMANHRYQVIVTGDLPDDAMEKYKAVRSSYPNDYFTLGNIEDATLMDLIKEGGSFDAVINRGLPPDGRIIVEKTTLSNIHIVVQQSLATNSLQASYPTRMPFYLYGTPEQQHIDHMLLVAPDQQLNSDQVKLDLDNKLAADDLAKGVVAVFTKVYENSLQPMLEDPEKEKSHSEYNVQGFTFKAKETFDVSIFSDLEAVNKKASPLASGTLTLGDSVFADDETINEDPAAHTEENESKEESEIEGKPSLRLRKAAQALRITGERVESKDLRKAAILGDWHNAYQDARKEVLSKSKQEAEVVDK